MKRLLIALLLMGLLTGCCKGSIADVNEAVVEIFTQDFDDYDRAYSNGHGIVINRDGEKCTVLTAAHVLTLWGGTAGPLCVDVKIRFLDGTLVAGKVVCSSYTYGGKYDLALIVIDKGCPELQACPIADEEARPGDLVEMQGAKHRANRRVAFRCNELTNDDVVCGSFRCWTGESGTAFIDSDGGVCGILTGGWKLVTDFEGNVFQRVPLDDGTCTPRAVWPSASYSNADDIAEFIQQAKDDEKARGDVSKQKLFVGSASWCSPCQKFKSDLKDMNLNGREVIIVDCDKHPEWRQQNKVSAYPTFILTDENGKELKRRIGYKDKKQLLNWIGN